MRSFVTTTFVLALALAPAAAFAQATTTTAQQPPATQQPPAQQPPAGGQPPAAGAQQPAAEAPKLTFKTPVGLLLVQVKPDQTAVFEEMLTKIQTGVAASSDPSLKPQVGAWKAFRAAEPGANGSVMYLVMIDPAVPGTEYQFFQVIQKTLTDEQKHDPKTAEMYKTYNNSIAAMNMMNLTPVKGGQ